MISNIMKICNITLVMMVGDGPLHLAKFPVSILHIIDAAAIWYELSSEEPLGLPISSLSSTPIAYETRAKIMDRGSVGVCSRMKVYLLHAKVLMLFKLGNQDANAFQSK